ncbi:MAG: hypothetical protein KBF88_02690 [Polyangiaceae bacterium]|nr:hypothetical protein [Polyangiaceae bacterium]
MKDERSTKMKTVYTVVERGEGKSFWNRIGTGFVNRDGSINLKLDALPTNGTLQIRDWEPREAGAGKSEGASSALAEGRPEKSNGRARELQPLSLSGMP